jgi:hypothetical protein
MFGDGSPGGEKMSSEGLNQVLKFIEEREQKLSRYTETLRNAVAKIFDVFGDKGECRFCGRPGRWHHKYMCAENNETTDDPEKYYNKNKARYYDSTGFVVLDSPIGRWKDEQGRIIFYKTDWNGHPFLPKIEDSIEIDGEPFFKNEEEEKEYKLAIRDHRLVFVVSDPTNEETYDAYEISRRALKEAIQTGAITKFLKQLADELDKTSKEYEEVSVIAEKLANAVA